MDRSISIDVRMNVSYEDAEYLYDEIRDHLSLCLERIKEHTALKDDVYHLQKILTPQSLTQYLSERMNTDQILVRGTFVAPDTYTFEQKLLIEIRVPNIWAMNYGKVTTEQLDDTINFLTKSVAEEKPQTTQKPVPPSTIMVNGEPVENPIAGSIFYDTLNHEMKIWDGSKWCKSASWKFDNPPRLESWE